jgi:hypothetical protein
MSSEVVAAVIAGSVSVVVASLTAVATFRTQERRLREELRTQFMAEEALRELLSHPDWRLRSFEMVSKRVRGFSDNELRQLLIRSGALCFERKADGAEMWGLRSRNEDELTKQTSDGSGDSPVIAAM